MKVHNLLVTGSLTSGGENISTISSSVATTVTNLSSSLNGRLDSIQTSTGSLNTFTSSANNRLNSVEGKTGSYATTGSNTFLGSQVVTGSLFISENLIVAGSSSIQHISSSVVNINDNIITVNALNPSVRFGGLAVIDSGSSPQVSGSMLFDSVNNQWLFVHQNQGTVTSSVLLMGPETFNNLGNESYITQNRLVKSTGIEHLADSNITDTGTKVSINSNTEVTGSLITTGNLGVGVTPSAWGDYRVLQLGGGSISSYVDNNFFEVNQNAFWNGSSYRYVNNGFASRYQQTVGRHEWYQAASGTAGNAISFTQAMTLFSSGNLLVGSPSPISDNGARLQVSGRLSLFNSASTASILINNTSNGWGFTQYQFNSTDYGYIGQANALFSGGSSTDFGIRAENNLTFGIGSAERMRITSSGNLGLGITPSAWSTSFGIKVVDVGSKGTFYASDNDVNVSFNQYFDGSNAVYKTNGTAARYAIIGNEHQWRIAPSGTTGNVISFNQAMTLDSSGNLLLNTTSTSSLGNGIVLRGDNDGVGGYGYIQISGNASVTRGIYLYNSNGLVGTVGTDGTSLLFATGGGDTERMRITSGGNVGIGTNSPVTFGSRNLDVNAGAGLSSYIVARANNNGGTIEIAFDTDAGYLSTKSNHPLIIRTNDIERMRVTSDGNVLVGATNADVGGSVKGAIIRQNGSIVGATNISSPFHYQSPIAADRMNTQGDGLMYGMWRGGIFQAGIGATNGSVMTFFTGNNDSMTERMRITSTGVVRINGFTSNGLVGTDASGNLGVVNSTYTEIATGTISYSMTSGAPWQFNNSFPSTIRNYSDDLMAGSAGVAFNSNINRGVTFDLGSAKAVRKIVERGYPTMNLDTILVQYSTDNSNWISIHTYAHVYGNTQKDMEFNPTGAISARYWRWLISGWTERETQNYYTYESIIYT